MACVGQRQVPSAAVMLPLDDRLLEQKLHRFRAAGLNLPGWQLSEARSTRPLVGQYIDNLYPSLR